VDVTALVRWTILAAYTAVITKLSLSPSSSLRFFSKYLKFAHADKVAHFAMYGVLAALLVWALRIRVARMETAARVVGVCLCYGLFLEVLQLYLLPGDRCFSLLDVTANTSGAIVSVALLALAERREPEELAGG
jgi:VanZ family protein